jgi:putative DNA primase/helicase
MAALRLAWEVSSRFMATRSFALAGNEIKRYYQVRVPHLKQKDAQWRGPCPIHKGERESFAVNPETGQAFCHSQCNRGWDIVGFEAELSDTDRKTAWRRVCEVIGRNYQRKIEGDHYDYVDEQGMLLYQCVRYVPKDFRQRRPDGRGGWIWNLKGVRLVLYRLPQVLAAETVFVVEGEKDVHTLESWGVVATCNPMGARKWRPEYSDSLAGKHVLVIPDADRDGAAHAEQVISSLREKAASSRLIQLPIGKDVTEWKNLGGTHQQLQQIVDGAILGPLDAVSAVVAERQFRQDQNGVWARRGGDQHDLWVCAPIEIVASTRTFEAERFGRLVRFHNRDAQVCELVIFDRELLGEGKEAVERLVDLGFVVGRSRKQIEAVKDFLHQARPKEMRYCVDRVGMHGVSFVLPDRSFSPPGAPSVVFDPGARVDHKYWTRGTCNEWRQHLGSFCSGNSRLVLAVSAGFAAPLLQLFGMGGGGFHFRGLSSTGKTTALRVAGSVWGGSYRGDYLDTWRGTANGIEATGSMHNDALLCLDEIGEINEKEAGEIIYALSNGGGKVRMTRALTARRNVQFRTLVLSTGERNLAEILQGIGRQVKGGQEARLVEIPADAGAGMGIFENVHGSRSAAEFASTLGQNARRYFGSPIREFLSHLVPNSQECENRVRGIRDAFVADTISKYASGEACRVGSLFGLVAGAGSLATDLGLTGWTHDEPIHAAETCFEAWLDARGGFGHRDVEWGIRAVLDFLERHGASRFQDLAASEAERSKIVNRAGFREQRNGEWVYYLFDQTMQDEVLRGCDFRDVTREMIDRGLLRTQKGGHHTVRKRLPGLGLARVYEVHMSDLDDNSGSGETE